jgi:hypothetical protein
MWMPEGLEQRRFRNWNRLVRALIEVWDAAHLLGKEDWFQEQLEGCREEDELLERLDALRRRLTLESEGTGYNLAERAEEISAPVGSDAETSPTADGEQEPG